MQVTDSRFRGQGSITPFLDYDYTRAKLKSFTETGSTGAELKINGGEDKRSWLTAGAKWTARFGAIVPEASLAWRHGFGDQRTVFNANFAASPETSSFDIRSATQKRDSVAGRPVGRREIGPVNLQIGYQGRSRAVKPRTQAS